MPEPKITPYQWYVVFILTLTSTVSFIDRQILALMVGPVKRDLDISDTEIGLLIGLAFAAFNAIVTLPIARLADRYSRRLIVALGIFFWSLMTVLSGFARNYMQLFLARMGVGIGEGIGPAAISLLTDYFSSVRLPIALGIYSSAPFLGVGLANILGGYVISYVESVDSFVLPVIGEIYSWQAAFLFVGAPGLLLALLYFTIKEPERRGLSEPNTQAVPVREIWNFLRDNRWFFIYHFGGFLFLATLGFALFAWVVELFIRVHAMPRAEIGLAYGLITLCVGLSGSLFGGLLASRLHSRGKNDATLRLVMYSTIAVAPLAVIMPLVPDPSWAIFLLCPITFCMSMPPGLGMAALQAVAPAAYRAQITAVYLLVVSFLSYVFGPLVVGFMNDVVYSASEIHYTMSTLALIGYPLAALLLWRGLKPFRLMLATASS